MNHYFHAHKPSTMHTRRYQSKKSRQHRNGTKKQAKKQQQNQHLYERRLFTKESNRGIVERNALLKLYENSLVVGQLFGKKDTRENVHHQEDKFWYRKTLSFEILSYGTLSYGKVSQSTQSWYWKHAWLSSIMRWMLKSNVPKTKIKAVQDTLKTIRFTILENKIKQVSEFETHTHPLGFSYSCVEYHHCKYMYKNCLKQMEDFEDFKKQVKKSSYRLYNNPILKDHDNVFIIRDIASAIYNVVENVPKQEEEVQQYATGFHDDEDKNNHSNKAHEKRTFHSTVFFDRIKTECCRYLMNIYKAARTDSVIWFKQNLLGNKNSHLLEWMDVSMCFQLAFVVACEFQSLHVIRMLFRRQTTHYEKRVIREYIGHLIKNRIRSSDTEQPIFDRMDASRSSDAEYPNRIRMGVSQACDTETKIDWNCIWPIFNSTTNIDYAFQNVCLQNACWNGRVDVLHLLVSHMVKQSPCVVFAYTECLQCACARGDIATVALLLKTTRSINRALGQDKMAMRLACLGGHSEIVKLLLSYSPVFTSSSTESPLWPYISNTSFYWPYMSNNDQTHYVTCLQIADSEGYHDIVVALLAYMDTLPYPIRRNHDHLVGVSVSSSSTIDIRPMRSYWHYLYIFHVVKQVCETRMNQWLNYHRQIVSKQPRTVFPTRRNFIPTVLDSYNDYIKLYDDEHLISSCETVIVFSRPEQAIEFEITKRNRSTLYFAWRPNQKIITPFPDTLQDSMQGIIQYKYYIELHHNRHHWLRLKKLWMEWVLLEKCLEECCHIFHDIAADHTTINYPMMVLSRICQRDIETEMAQVMEICPPPFNPTVPQLVEYDDIRQWALQMRASVFWTDRTF